MTRPGVRSELVMVDRSAVDDPLWDAFVRSRRSDVFHSPDWSRVLADTYGFDPRGRLLLAEGEPVAGIAFVTVDDHLGVRHVSLPFSDFCDPLVGSTSHLDGLLGDLIECDHPVSVKTLRDAHTAGWGRLSPVGRAAWHRVDVREDRDAAWASLDPSARRAVRKAVSSGVTVRPGGSVADVRSFFELHLAVRKHKYRMLSQPWAFFESIWERFLAPGRGVLLLGELDGRVVSGVLFLQWMDTLYYKFNASAADALSARPNDAVLWEGMRWAHERGLAWMDFGVSDLDQPGLIRYKEKYATEQGEMTVLRKPDVAVDPRAVEARDLLTGLTTVLVDDTVPCEITERAGDLMYRYFV